MGSRSANLARVAGCPSNSLGHDEEPDQDNEKDKLTPHHHVSSSDVGSALATV
jgi:hypothetical protein